MASSVTSLCSQLFAGRRLPAATSVPSRPSLLLPVLSRRSFLSIQQPVVADRFSSLQVRPNSSSEDSSPDELLADLYKKWEAVEDKITVFLYGGGAIVAVWLTSIVIGAINSIPLLPKILELVGLGYSGWFVYRYLLFKESREELASEIDDLKKKIAGTGK